MDCQYSVGNNIRFKTSMQISDLCDYSDAYTGICPSSFNNVNF